MKAVHVGRVGVDFTADEAAVLAKITGLELVASLKRAVGDLGRVKRIHKENGYIACPDSFTQLPTVLNGCSNLLGEIFEDRGVVRVEKTEAPSRCWHTHPQPTSLASRVALLHVCDRNASMRVRQWESRRYHSAFPSRST